MPLDFEAQPGLGVEATRNARPPHHVYATGPALVLRTFIPGVAAIPQPNGSIRYDLAFVCQLAHLANCQACCRCQYRRGPGRERDPPLTARNGAGAVHTRRPGHYRLYAFCGPGTHQAYRRSALSLYVVEQLPFEARAADLYPVLMAPCLAGELWMLSRAQDASARQERKRTKRAPRLPYLLATDSARPPCWPSLLGWGAPPTDSATRRTCAYTCPCT